MSGYGYHWSPCDGGSGGGLVALVAVVAVIGAALHAVWHQLVGAARIVVQVAEITALVLVGAAGLAALAGITYASVRIFRAIRGRQTQRAIPVRSQVVQLGGQPLITGRAIEAPRQHPAGWPLTGDWQEVEPSNEPGRS